LLTSRKLRCSTNSWPVGRLNARLFIETGVCVFDKEKNNAMLRIGTLSKLVLGGPMDVATLLHPFSVALEAITTLSSVQLVLLNVFLVSMTGGALVSGYSIGRRATKQDVIESTTIVAIEQDPKSPHLGTYEELGSGFTNDERGTFTITGTSYVTSLAHALARRAKRRPTQAPDEPFPPSPNAKS
jgi:hypothetical protein